MLLIILIVLVLVFGFGGYRMGPGMGITEAAASA